MKHEEGECSAHQSGTSRPPSAPHSTFPAGELLSRPADFDRTPQSPLTIAGSSAGLCTPVADSHGQLSPDGHNNVGDLCEQKELGLGDGPQSSTLRLRRNQGGFLLIPGLGAGKTKPYFQHYPFISSWERLCELVIIST